MASTSVLGIAFKDGVVIAADTLVSYGKMAKYMDVKRILEVNNHTIVAASGSYADFQFLTNIIEQKQIDEEQWNDGLELYPAALHSWVSRVAYNRRSKFDPLYCSWLVGGLQPNLETGQLEPFLGFTDMLGTSFTSKVICTGFGQYLATPLIRELTEKLDQQLPSEEEAIELIKKSLEMLFYRDCRAYPRFYLTVVKPGGVKTEGPLELKGDWTVAYYRK